MKPFRAIKIEVWRQISDVRAIATMMNECQSESHRLPEKNFFRFFWQHPEWLATKGAFLAKTPSGILVGVLIYRFRSVGLVKIIDLVVRPEWRRRGIAKQLLQQLVAYAKVQQRKRVVVTKTHLTWQAERFFRSQGFLNLKESCGSGDWLYRSLG